MSTSFWGLQVEPEQAYTQTVDEAFRISQVALDLEVKSDERSSLVVNVDGEDYVLCSLTPGKIEQCSLDLVFSEGETVTFQVTGKNVFHVTGNLMVDDENLPMEGEFDDEDIDSDVLEYDGITDEESELDDEDEEMSDAEGKIIELDDDEGVDVSPKPAEKKHEPKKKQEQPKPQEKKPEQSAKKQEQKQKPQQEKPAKEQPKKQEKRPADEDKEQPEKKKKVSFDETAEEKPAKPEQKKTTLPSGLVIEEVQTGNGQKAKQGKRVLVRYIGKLQNGKVFDSNTKGKPFSFVLGRGEVIKGWDQGIVGMAAGSVRKLTIPPKLAYGAQGAPPDIPKNATLTFEVKLLDIK